MEPLLSTLAGKLDPTHIFALIVLYGVWKFINKGLALFSDHGGKLTDGINNISLDIKGIRSDLSVAVSEIRAHDVRISKLEDK